MMLGVFKKNINKTNASIIELSKDQQITFNVPTNSELKIQMDMILRFSSMLMDNIIQMIYIKL